MNLGKDRAILGYPWLKDFAPKINWANGRVEGPETKLEAKWYQLAKKRSESAMIRRARAHPEWEEGDKILKVNLAQQWAEVALKNKTPTEIPPQYNQYRQVFSEEAAARFPPSRPEDHAIKLKPGAPDTINCKVYPLTEAEKEATRKWVEEHEKKNYIEKSTSPWSTPWFFITKKDGSLRPIQDYQEVNKWTIRDVYPMPCIEQLMENLVGKELFTKFDICSGYHNVRIKPNDRWKAAFKTPFGLYQPNVMWFGLSNSPATFQHLVDRVMKPVYDKYPDYCFGYMDDFLIATKNDLPFHKEVVCTIL
jgi:Reverse transcriptase (RNA-dependent DNA polymerase)